MPKSDNMIAADGSNYMRIRRELPTGDLFVSTWEKRSESVRSERAEGSKLHWVNTHLSRCAIAVKDSYLHWVM